MVVCGNPEIEINTQTLYPKCVHQKDPGRVLYL